MRIAVLNNDAVRFHKEFYGSDPSLARAPYATQMQARADSLVGMADFYSRNFRALGHEACEFYVNNPYMQAAWASEHGMRIEPPAPDSGRHEDRTARLRRALQPYRAWLAPVARRLGLKQGLAAAARDVLLAQIEDFAPDVIINQTIALVDHDMIRTLRRPGRVIVAQHGVAPPEGIDLGVYDLGVSMLPYVVDAFRTAGVPAEVVHLAFEPSVLERLGPAPERDIGLTFVGGIEAQYNDRIAMLEAICERFPVEFYLTGTSVLSPSSPILKHQRGEVWGREMYRVLQRSQLTLNSHIDAARNYAGNMRLFEATGSGASLLTDAKSNLSTLFDTDREVATYSDIESCLRAIERLLASRDARAEMAAAGQQRTLATHTYRQRAATLLDLIARHGERGKKAAP
ncbi:MAG: glycosyltransferase [Proteobacteria bacterium]|nr:glycosyltransferase [Pseudomonadota bacterium]